MISCDPSFLYDFKEEMSRTENPLTNGSVKLDKNKKTIAVMVDERSAAILPGMLGDKYNLVSLYRKWNGYISLPNRTFKRNILCEMWGNITPLMIAEKLKAELSDAQKLNDTRELLLKLSGAEGAASRLCDIATGQIK